LIRQITIKSASGIGRRRGRRMERGGREGGREGSQLAKHQLVLLSHMSMQTIKA
jgi:hypothetical protein